MIADNVVSDIQMNKNDGVPTVEEFAKIVAETTRIPVPNQRLIFKGMGVVCMTTL
jgi:hypothetical protein